MNRLATIAGTAGMEPAAPRRQRPRFEPPPHIEEVLETIRNRFAAARDERPFDHRDTLAFAKVLAPLTPAQCRRVEQLLRERHTFRPMVSHLKAAVDEITRANVETVEACDAQSRTVVRRPLALPPHPDNPGRLEFREALRRMKAGQRPGPDTGLGGVA